MKPTTPLPDDWPFLLSLLPPDLEVTARQWGALQRQRGVGSAAALLRLAFAYACGGLSLQATATWAREAGVAQLSAVALFYRLRAAADWCGHLLAQQLAKRAALRWEQLPVALRLCLIDATTVRCPGSSAADYRLHLQLDLATLTITALTWTEASGGESLRHAALAPGEVVVGDRGYAHRPGSATVAAAG